MSTQSIASASAPADPNPHPGMGFRQFVGLIAAMMAVNALAIDSMLPAMPQIGHALHVATDNERQWILTSYLLGFGAAQIAYGPLADRYGRKPVLLVGLALYVVFAAGCAFATSFPMLLAARALCGVGGGGASTRVLSVSIVRDCYSGRQMARVMSLSFIVFLGVPIIAPSVGQAILLVAPWPWVFGILAIFGLIVIVWSWLKLPETLHPQDRVPLAAGPVMAAFKECLTNRIAVGYTLAATLVLGGLFGFLNSAQQVFIDVLGAGKLFTVIFAAIAGGIALSSLLNSYIVGRVGMRMVSHVSLFGYIAFAVVHALVALGGHETIWTFSILQAGMMFCFGMVMSNFGSIAMEPLGHLAGTAASVQGFITTIGGALSGFCIGQLFDGTTVPLTLGFAGFGIAGLVAVLITEKGRMFHAGAGPAGEAAGLGH